MIFIRRTRNVAAFLAATFLWASFGSALAQQPDQLPPSVSLSPAGTQSTDPNLGGWFVFQLAPGETTQGRARITNVAEVRQHVKLYLADLVFAKNGVPSVVDGPQQDVGAWGKFRTPDVFVEARSTIEAVFDITVPAGAEPGDHVGVVVAESDPQPGGVAVVKRVATRLYVTVPGDARRSMEIESLTNEVDSKFWPRRMLSKVSLRNTGRIRLRPKVQIRDAQAEGSEVLLARSIEEYVADVKIPWYGGRVSLPVQASAEGGITRRLNASKFVINWALLVLLAVLGGIFALVRRWWIRRASRLAQLHADIRRIETLVTQRPVAEAPPAEVSEEDEERAAILAGLKRAIRTQSQLPLERLSLALHEMGEDAIDYLMEALRNPSDANREALIEAAASYPPSEAVSGKRLPDDVASELSASRAEKQGGASKARPKTASKPKPVVKPKARTSGPPQRAKRKPLPAKHKPKTKKPKN